MKQDGKISVAYLQKYLKGKDFNPDYTEGYILKLFEEAGELSDALKHRTSAASDTDFRGSIEEELWDVMYYILCIANLRGIDLETWIRVKEQYNHIRYHEEPSAEMPSPLTIAYLQEYIVHHTVQRNDPRLGDEITYVLKLFEEIGELSRAIYRNVCAVSETDFRGSVEEELWDVMYFLLCIANHHGIDMEKWIQIKEDYNNARYNPGVVFDSEIIK